MPAPPLSATPAASYAINIVEPQGWQIQREAIAAAAPDKYAIAAIERLPDESWIVTPWYAE